MKIIENKNRIMFLFSQKKALSEIISILLLLITGIIVFASLQTWYFNYYQSDIESIAAQNSVSIEILRINSSNIYIKNPNSFDIEINRFSINDNVCIIPDTLYALSITVIPTSNCFFRIHKGVAIVKITSVNNVFSEKVIIEEQIN